jgi:hypothetical protein
MNAVTPIVTHPNRFALSHSTGRETSAPTSPGRRNTIHTVRHHARIRPISRRCTHGIREIANSPFTNSRPHSGHRPSERRKS